MGCSKCDSTHVVNKWFSLCRECNNERLHGSKYGKQVDYKAKESKPLKTSKNKSTNKRIVDKGKRVISSGNKKSKSFQTILLDEIFYEKCFNLSNNKCEECKTKLPDEFRVPSQMGFWGKKRNENIHKKSRTIPKVLKTFRIKRLTL